MYVLIAVVLIAALYLINNPITGNVIATNTTKEYDYSRSGNPDYYSLLPPMPSDFKVVKLMWQQGIIRDDPNRINDSYWKQPEWWPLYAENFLSTIKYVAESNRMPVWSLGVFNSQIYRAINQEWLKNASNIPETTGHGELEIRENSLVIKHRFWLRAAPGTVKIYGVRISADYPPEANLLGITALSIPNETVKQDPEIAKKYIKVTAVERDSGEIEFNFGTYWPKLSPEYIKEIELTAEIDKNTPKGMYMVGVNVGAPSREYQEQQSLKYLLAYTDPNIGMYRGPTKFVLFIEVI